jgi:hypothetical protein
MEALADSLEGTKKCCWRQTNKGVITWFTQFNSFIY